MIVVRTRIGTIGILGAVERDSVTPGAAPIYADPNYTDPPLEREPRRSTDLRRPAMRGHGNGFAR